MTTQGLSVHAEFMLVQLGASLRGVTARWSNGQKKEICSSNNLGELLHELGIVSPHCAVALNLEVVPNSKLNQTEIREGDSVEIVHAVGGGL